MSRINNNDRISRQRIDCWETRWAGFLDKHGSWWQERSACGEPVYCIINKVIDKLCEDRSPGGRRTGKRLLSSAEESNERAFYDLCVQWGEGIIGVTSKGTPIRFSIAARDVAEWRPGMRRPIRRDESEKSPPLQAEFFRMAALRVEQLFDTAWAQRQAIAQSQLVHIGWLLQQQAYWEDLRVLKSLCHRIKGVETTARVLPLAAWAKIAWQDKPIKQVAEIQLAVAGFARKWCLSELLTWDLPNPQSPLYVSVAPFLPNSLGISSVRAMPAFMHPSRLEGDGRIVWQLPPTLARRAGGSDDAVSAVCRANQVPTYSLLMTIYLTLVAVRGRFSRLLPTGSKDRIFHGLSCQLGKDFEHIKRVARKLRHAF